jgi:hypothetical protein
MVFQGQHARTGFHHSGRQCEVIRRPIEAGAHQGQLRGDRVRGLDLFAHPGCEVGVEGVQQSQAIVTSERQAQDAQQARSAGG